jgi:peroxiredoxin family protein
MTATLTAPVAEPVTETETITKVSIIISKGSLDGIYPGLIMANGARMEGMEANVFFTFFGLEAVLKGKNENIKVATVGNPAMHMPTMLGGLPGMSALATKMMMKKMEELDIPPVAEFVQLLADSGAKLYGCHLAVQMFDLKREDFIDDLVDIITVGDFYHMAAGGPIIFT